MVRIKGMGYITEGKGFSPVTAKASAYAEMAERFSSRQIAFTAFNSVKNIPKYNTLLKDVIEIKFLLGYTKISKADETTHSTINRYFKEKISHGQYNILKNQQLLDTLVDSYSFINKCYQKIPIKLIEMMSGSNGVASGNTLEEALVQASCEIFERFAALNVVTKKIQCPTLRMDSIEDNRIRKFIKMFDSMNIEIRIKDFSLKEQLPVAGVLFINHNVDDDKNELKRERHHKKLIAGSHPNLKEAILGCFSEYIQLENNKDDLLYGKKTDILYNFWTKTLGKKYLGLSHRFNNFFHYYDYYGDLSFLEKGKTRSFDDLESSDNSDSLDDFKSIIDTCKRNKWDVQAIDYTHKILRFPTVRVIIPPISTDYNPDIRSALNFESFEERFNYFYGIKDFYNYFHNDNWIEDNQSIATLIENIEEYLSQNLFFYHIWIYLGYFLQFINLFHILAFANLSLGKYEEALKYFRVLLDLEDKPDFHSEYSDIIFNYTPSYISAYITLLEKRQIENKKIPKFRFKSNPFKREEIGLEHSEYLFSSHLRTINDSFL